MNQCVECKFFSRESEWRQWGSCHRHAPVIDAVEIVMAGASRFRNEHEPSGVWPKVQTAYWCGDWEAKES